MAQFGSVSEWGSEGRRFKSSRPDQENQGVRRCMLNPFVYLGFLSPLFCVSLSPSFLEFPEYLREKLIIVNNISILCVVLSKPNRISYEEMRRNDYRYLGCLIGR